MKIFYKSHESYVQLNIKLLWSLIEVQQVHYVGDNKSEQEVGTIALHVNMVGISHMTIRDPENVQVWELDVKFHIDKHEISWSSNLI